MASRGQSCLRQLSRQGGRYYLRLARKFLVLCPITRLRPIRRNTDALNGPCYGLALSRQGDEVKVAGARERNGYRLDRTLLVVNGCTGTVNCACWHNATHPERLWDWACQATPSQYHSRFP